MKKGNSFVQFIVEQIQDAGSVSYRSMFGGYAIYCDTKVVALVCDNELFIKPTQNGKEFIGKVKKKPPYPGAKPYFFIQDGIDDKQWMSELVRLTATELPPPKRKKPIEKIQGKKEKIFHRQPVMDNGTQQMKPSQQSEEYRARIHRVQDFIERNIQETLSLAVLAKVACFSPFHFHRIFSAMTGETLGQFIARIRIEKAAMKLTANPKLSITTVALECGFSGSAAFARSFNEAFGMSASTWRNGGYHLFSNGRKTESNPGKTIGKQRKATDTSLSYLDGVPIGEGASPVQHPLKTRSRSMKKASSLKADVCVENFPEMTVAYVRHVGPYRGNDRLFKMLWGKLMKWAGPKGLMAQPDAKMLCVYHDDPEVTDETKLRVSVCVTVPSGTRVDGEIGLMNIAPGAYATARFQISEQEFQSAWDYMFGVWLPQSGYQPDDRLCFEWCMNDPEKHPEHKHIVKICIPVRPL